MPRSPSVSPSSKRVPPPAPYHHGDLRRVIVDAALSLLAEQKHWDFSLRKVARRAGVSHNAPYNHFADKHALLSAVATAGFQSLRERMQKLSQGARDPHDALVVIAAGYVTFGVRHPALYRLMFSLALATPDGGLSPEMAGAAAAAKAVLKDVVERCAAAGQFTPSIKTEAGLALAVLSAWSLVHGLTMLSIDGLAGGGGGTRAVKDIAENVAGTLLSGLQQR